MSHIVRIVGCAAVAFAISMTPAVADCKKDVAGAFEKQRKTSAFRMKTRMISERGLVNMTVDYLLPYKMHQTVKVATSPANVEIVLIGTQAWSSVGLGWTKLGAMETEQIVSQMRSSVIDPPKDPLKYDCLGTVDLEGREVLGYQGKQGRSDNVATTTVVLRTVYVDPKSGLPVRSTVARASKPDLAFFKADYSYPTDISIVAPKNAKPAPPLVGGKPDSKSETPASKNQSTAP